MTKLKKPAFLTTNCRLHLQLTEKTLKAEKIQCWYLLLNRYQNKTYFIYIFTNLAFSGKFCTHFSETFKKSQSTRFDEKIPNYTNLWKRRWFGVWRTYNSKGESEDKHQISCPCRIVTISLRSFAKNSEWDCNSFFICNQWHWICFCIMLHTPPITHLSFAWDRFKVKPVNFYFTTIQSHLSCIVFP